MRGTLSEHTKIADLARITPAYAGNTWAHQGAHTTAWDHPRVCGEHHAYSLPVRTCEGSPPRMRGTQWGDEDEG